MTSSVSTDTRQNDDVANRPRESRDDQTQADDQHVSDSSAAGPASAWGLPLAVLIVGMFMSVLDTSIVNVAVPSIQKNLGGSSDDVEWIVTAYTLALGVVVPLNGWLGERIGPARLYTISLVGFALTSALCGMAWDLPSLIAFRVVQAIPGGILPVITLTILYQIVPREKIGSAMGLYGLGVIFAPAVGPTLGGYLVEYVSWRLIFYINVPVGLLGALAAAFVFHHARPTSWSKFDLWGFLAVAYGLFALLLACSEGQDWGWLGYRVLMLLTSGALSLALFVVLQLEAESPLLDVRVFANWAFTNSVLLVMVLSVTMFTVLYYVPVFLQQGQGMQPFRAGLVMLPPAIVMVVVMPLSGQLYDRIGPRWLGVAGLLLCAYGLLLMAQLAPNTTSDNIIVWTSVLNLGAGLAMMPIMTSGLAALPEASIAAGSALNNVAQRVSASIGLAIFAALATSGQAQVGADQSALLATGAQMLPQLAAAQEQGVAGLYPIYQKLQAHALATSYANIFLVVSMICALSVPFALALRSTPNRAETAAPGHL